MNYNEARKTITKFQEEDSDSETISDVMLDFITSSQSITIQFAEWLKANDNYPEDDDFNE